jgi:vacuolar-type H+-ATPase subunit E/Vma4
MSLESLVDEIRAHGESELKAIADRRGTDLRAIASDREARVAQVRSDTSRATDAEVARNRAQRMAAAHLAARRLLYEAREERLAQGFAAVRGLLADLTGEPGYVEVLRRMIARAGERLGRSARVSGRAEDAALLGRLAGKSFDPTARPILGGIVAETPDGRRRLDLSFDELLRQHADAVRALLV